MLANTAFAAAALALSGVVTALPAQSRTMTAAEIMKQAWIVDQRMLAAFECRGQSCMIADSAGSTGRPPILHPEGADVSDVACISKHNPEAAELLKKYENKVPYVPKQNTTFISDAIIGINKLLKPFSNPRITGNYTGKCAPNILIFAKGTFEPGIAGITIGPMLSTVLPANWTLGGVDYDPDIAGDFCLGLPGGMVARDTINDANKKCPDSNLFLGGFSQGAMVIRNGLARVNDQTRAKVKGLVTWGDPFNGAPVKDYKGPIEVFCDPKDGVCTGNFEVSLGHGAYLFDSSVATGMRKLVDWSNGVPGDSKCCNPPPYGTLPSPEKWKETIAANGGQVPKAAAGVTIDQWADSISKSNGKVPSLSAKFASSEMGDMA